MIAWRRRRDRAPPCIFMIWFMGSSYMKLFWKHFVINNGFWMFEKVLNFYEFYGCYIQIPYLDRTKDHRGPFQNTAGNLRWDKLPHSRINRLSIYSWTEIRIWIPISECSTLKRKQHAKDLNIPKNLYPTGFLDTPRLSPIQVWILCF